MKPVSPYALVPLTSSKGLTHALIELTPERSQEYLTHADLVAGLLDDGRRVCELVIFDDSPTWHSVDQLASRGANESAKEKLRKLARLTLKLEEPRLLHPELFSPGPLGDDQQYDVEHTRISVDPISFQWKTHVLGSYVDERETTTLLEKDICRALAFALPDKQLSALLKRMVDTYPALALDMIEYGVAVESAHDEIRRPIVVPTAALSPYLNHHERDIRERAIRLLGRTPARAMRR